MAKTTGTAAVAERPTDALWLAALPSLRVSAVQGHVPAPAQEQPCEGTLSGLPGAVTDLALSRDGRLLVAAHYGADAVSLIDPSNLTVRATVEGVPEPGRIAVADRVYVTSAGIDEDGLTAIALDGGVRLATKRIDAHVRGLAVSPAGDTLFVGRGSGEIADVAAVNVESGVLGRIEVSKDRGAGVDTVRVSPDGSRLYVSLAGENGDAVLVVDIPSGRLLHSITCSGSVADIAVHHDGRRAFVAGWDENLGGVLTIIDTAAGRIIDVIPVGGMSTQVALTGACAYVVSDDVIAVVDIATARVVDTIGVGRPISCIAVNSEGTGLYIADFDGTIESRSFAGDSLLRAAS